MLNFAAYLIIKITFIMQNKKIALAAWALAVLPATAQQYEVTGEAPAGAKVVYLQNMQSRTPDSVAVANGKFKFVGEAEGRIFARVGTASGEAVPVVLDGKVRVDLATGKAGGTVENDALAKWNERFAEPRKRLQALMEEYYGYRQKGQEVPAEVEARINKEYVAETARLNALVKQCCEQNRDRKFPALFLAQSVSGMDKAEAIKLAEEGNPAYMQTSLMERTKQAINGWKRQLPGVAFTDLELAAPDGKTHKLSEYVGKGKYVLIDFWASWCGPCRREMPNVKALYEKYKDKGFDIVGLSLDNDKAAWTASIEKLGLPWHHLSDLKGWQSLAATTYGVNSIPATLLIGPDGKVVAGGLGTEEIDQKLSELLQ